MNKNNSTKTAGTTAAASAAGHAKRLYDCYSLAEISEVVSANETYFGLNNSINADDALQMMLDNRTEPEIWKRHFEVFVYHIARQIEIGMGAEPIAGYTFLDKVLPEFTKANVPECEFFAERPYLICLLMTECAANYGPVDYMLRIIALDKPGGIDRYKAAIAAHQRDFIKGLDAFDDVTEGINAAFATAVDELAVIADERPQLIALLEEFREYHNDLGKNTARFYRLGQLTDNLAAVGNDRFYKTAAGRHEDLMRYYYDEQAHESAYSGVISEWRPILEDWFKNPAKDVVFDYIVNFYNHGLRVLALGLFQQKLRRGEVSPELSQTEYELFDDLFIRIQQHPMTSVAERQLIRLLEF